MSCAGTGSGAWTRVRPVRGRLARIGYVVVVVSAAVLFERGASTHAEHMNRHGGKDQGPYLLLGRRVARTHAMSLDGARPPLYPALLAIIHEPSASKDAEFEKARRATIWWTLAAWIAFLFVLRRRLRPYTALVTWLASGFTVWMFYAPYVKAEALFYFFATGSFMLMLDLLWRPRLRNAVFAGLITAIAYLFKASLGPALLLFSAVQTLSTLIDAVRARRGGRGMRRSFRRALTVPVLLGVFVAATSPYLIASKAKYGHYFYNVNSDFYVWYDSWGESGRGTRGHGDRQGWPNLPPEQIPSAQKYFAKHGVGHALARVGRGARGLTAGMLRTYGFLPLVVAALASVLITLGTRRTLGRWLLRRWPITLFAAGYFAGYFLLCTWFYAIHPGLRFVSALVPPALFACGWLADRGKAIGRVPAWIAFPVLVGGTLLAEAPTLFQWVYTLGMAGW